MFAIRLILKVLISDSKIKRSVAQKKLTKSASSDANQMLIAKNLMLIVNI